MVLVHFRVRTEHSLVFCFFFIFALLFLLSDLEILLVYPYLVSAYTNGVYGLVVMLMFLLALTLGFAFELGKKANVSRNCSAILPHLRGTAAPTGKTETRLRYRSPSLTVLKLDP